MKIQVFSDLHIEKYNHFPRLKCVSPYLILAGDIGHIDDENYKLFINYCSGLWKKVIVVLGNHEFYDKTNGYTQLMSRYRDFFDSYSNIVLLENEEVMLEDYKVLGCTMWCSIDEEFKSFVNSIRHIHYVVPLADGITLKDKMGIRRHNRLYEDSKKWLLESYNPDEKTIIITHHPITQENVRQLQWRHEPDEQKSSFSSELSLTTNNKCVCISGHTHFSHDYTRNGVRYISNQYGYCNEPKDKTLYNKLGCYTI